MAHPRYIYELLLDHCTCDAVVDQLLIGLVWTLCLTRDKACPGLSMSPGFSTRTLNWSGSLTGKPVSDLAAWITDWDPFRSTVAMAAINSCINSRTPPDSETVDTKDDHVILSVFDYFLPQLLKKNVVVIGHYPGIERYKNQMHLSVIEKEPSAVELPDSACEFLLPQADWVFLSASSIPNKTFPRLAELSASAKTVLMGPTTPWLPQLHEFGVDYLAGVEVVNSDVLFHTAAQGGGVKIFNQGLRYRIAELNPSTSINWLKSQIAGCSAEQAQIKSDMESWYAKGNNHPFPGYDQLEHVNSRLSRMDSSYKALWDRYSSLAGSANPSY